jgi:hypothetical protein
MTTPPGRATEDVLQDQHLRYIEKPHERWVIPNGNLERRPSFLRNDSLSKRCHSEYHDSPQ